MVLFSQNSLNALAKVSQILGNLSTDPEQLGKSLVAAGYQGIPGNFADDPIANMLRDRGLNVFSIEKSTDPDTEDRIIASVVVAGHATLLEMPQAVVTLWTAFHAGGWPELVRLPFRGSHSAKLVTMSATPVPARYSEHHDAPLGADDAKALPAAAPVETHVGSPTASAKRGPGRPRKHAPKISRT